MPTKTNLQKISSTDFIKFLLATDELFEDIKASFLEKYRLTELNINRIRLGDINAESSFGLNSNDLIVTYFLNIEITESVTINVHTLFKPVNVVIENSKIINIDINNLMVSEKQDDYFTENHLVFINTRIESFCLFDISLDNLNFIKCPIDKISIINCSTEILLEETNLNFFEIDKQSHVANMSICDGDIDDTRFTLSNIDYLQIENSKFGKIVIDECCLNGYQLEKSSIGDINILTSIIGELSLEECNTGNCWINNSELGKKLIIEKCNIKDIEINNSLVKDKISINKSIVKKILITEYSATNQISITNSSADELKIERKSTTGNIILNGCILGYFNATELFCEIRLVGATIPIFYLTKSDIIRFYIGQSCKIDAKIYNCQIVFLDFRSSSLSSDSTFSFSKIGIYSLIIENISIIGHLYFRQINSKKLLGWNGYTKRGNRNISIPTKVKNLPALQKLYENMEILHEQQDAQQEKYINDFVIRNQLLLPTIRIVNSSLGKTEFIDCNLNAFSFEYRNSNITDIIILGVTEFISPSTIQYENKTIEYEQLSTFFNQMKKVFERQGDIYRSSLCQVQWAIVQEKLLKIKRREEMNNKPIGKKVKILVQINSQDIYTLWLNKLSNKHGESWLSSLMFIFITGGLFYCLYLFTVDRIFNLNNVDLNLIGYYFEFLNPVHKVDFIREVKINGWTIFVDFLGRITIGYGIYQLISAFRKNAKKI